MSARENKGLPNYVIGIIAIVLIVLGFYMAFTKSLPWSGGYEVKAVVKNAQNLAVKSPVRIAGVDVGKVKNVESATNAKGQGEQAAIVTMEITDAGRPIHTDAKLQLRPRLFLEGNLFVELQPGSPSAPEADDGFMIPIQHTANFVQLDQVLTSLQSDTRKNLQLLLQELGDSFVKYGGASGLREFFKSSAVANRSTSEVNQAVLGTEPHDLSELIVNLDRTVQGLGRNEEQLKGLITSLRIVTGSFAAQSESLETAIQVLPEVLSEGSDALVNLNTMFPPLRAFSRELLPGVRSAGPALDAANPWIYQLRKLISKPELRGLIKDLRPVIPQLAQLSVATPPFLEEARALSSCFANVVVPWGDDAITPQAVVAPPNGGPPVVENTGIPVYKETSYGLVGLAGESRSGDANGEYIRVSAGGGVNTVVFPSGGVGSGIERTVGVTPYQLLGYEPAIAASAKTPFRPDIPCETQEPPNLSSGGIANPPATMSRPAANRGAQQNALRDVITESKDLQGLIGQFAKLGRRNAATPEGLALTEQISEAFKDILLAAGTDPKQAEAQVSPAEKPSPNSKAKSSTRAKASTKAKTSGSGGSN